MKLFILINANASIELHDMGYGLFLKLIDGRECFASKRVDSMRLSQILNAASEMAKKYEESTNTNETQSFKCLAGATIKRDGK